MVRKARDILRTERLSGRPSFDSKRERAIYYAEKRMTNTLNQLRLLGNLSNRVLYEFTPDEIKVLERTLVSEVEKLKVKLERAHLQPRPASEIAPEAGFSFEKARKSA